MDVLKPQFFTPPLSTKALVAAGLIFNLFWLLAVLGQNDGVWLLMMALLVCWWRYPSCLKFVIPVAIAGSLMDSALMWTGIYRFEAGSLPIWLVVLWFGFGSFLWFLRMNLRRMSPLVLCIAGSLGGASSYLAGLQLGVVLWPLGKWLTFLIVSTCWLLFSGMVLMWIRRLP
ncbi:DUF2878 domain-containing protein [Photobacterium sp. 1_MG-2023]|uniref:DUF2878 domain-containing protein n=1 Tax=Photobacterium sp. 1_MG-2023 TaxID=3062646 RepID=UPI0026E20F43|nr:DUF2878 domain-containing protein [Photobacterium sp. 1_MG-2023]MDO6706972.1 DUF2878 domain-containing protein [Photobacterium sp. 1_MG-2023]